MSTYFKCAVCLTVPGAPDWKARATISWVNQFGIKKRIFCDVCGSWTDVRLIYATDETLTVVVKKGNHQKGIGSAGGES